MANGKNDIKRLLLTDVFFLGFTLTGVQIILIREFLLLFNGNELVIGILFTIWMLSSAIGAWTGRFIGDRNNHSSLIRALLVLLTVYPLVAVFSIEYFRNDIFEGGRLASLYEIISYSFIVLLPICFTGGFLFTLMNTTGRKVDGNLQSYYAIESFGSLVSGILISLYFIYILQVDNFRSLTYLLLINFVYFGISDFRQGKQLRSYIFLLMSVGIMFLIYYANPGIIAKKKFFEGQDLILTKETPFGNLSVTETAGQLNYYENGLILFSDGNVIQREEDIHYAMLQRPLSKKVLLIGGGVSGTISEVLKYQSVEQIIYVEINPDIIKLNDELLKNQASPIVKSFAIDPILFIKQTNETFDVVFVNLPPPVNAQLNRYYSLEFYQRLKYRVTKDGLISTRLPSSENYLSDDEVKLQASIFNSIDSVFKNVLIIPGDNNYFLATDDKIDFDSVKWFDEIQNENAYVNANYINVELLKFRSESILGSFGEINYINHDFKPKVYLQYIQHWMGYYGNSFWIIPILCLFIVVAFTVFSKPFSSVMFTSGFTGVATEIVLLIVFQVMVGYVYLFLGVIITLFMAGLSIGAFLSRKVKVENANKLTISVQVLTGILILGIAAAIFFLKDILSIYNTQYLISIFMLVISSLVGYQYGVAVLASKGKPSRVVSTIYAADLIGSAIGSLLVVILIIPILGIYNTLFCLSGFHLLTLLFFLLKKKINYL